MVSTMIAAAFFEIGTAAYAATVFAVNFAISQIVTRVFGTDQQNPQDNGVRQQVPPSSTNAMPIAYGDVYMGGTFVDAVLTTDQKTMYYVLAVSSISPNGQFSFDTTKFYYGDRLIGFDSVDHTKVTSLSDEAIPPNVDQKISGNLYINLYKSDAAGNITSLNGASAPSVVMGGTDIASAQRWPSTGRQMNGLAFAIVKLTYNQDAGTTNLSPITFHCSHYLNGAGCAKPGDVWYDYITNKIYGGAVGWLPDGSFSSAFVDSSSAATLNAYSDELITFNNSSGVPSTQARYRMNGVLDAGQSVLTNIDKIMSCCDSWMTYNSALGQWSVVVNKPETAAYAFNDNNIIGEIRISATDITSSINQIEAKFPFNENRDQPSFVQLATPSNLLYPNEPANKYSITYDLVNESVQASYLANRLLEQAREDLIVSFSTTYYGIQVDAGAVISVTNSVYGWSNKLFRVMKVNEASLPDGSLGAKLELNEYNAAVYDNYDVTAFTPAPNSNIPAVGYFSSLSAPTISDADQTATFPSFAVNCVIPTTGRVTTVTLFYTTVASPAASDWIVWGVSVQANSLPFTNGSTVKFSNVSLPAATYYFGFTVQNEFATSSISGLSTGFTWSPNPTTSAVAGTFLASFSPAIMQVPRSSGGTPSFTGIITQLYGSAAGGAIDFVTSQTDSDSAFVNNSWRIGGSSTTGNGDIVYSNITLGSITDGGNYAQWGIPTAMSTSPATLTVPVRYKSSLGVVSQAANAILKYYFLDPGPDGTPGTDGDISAQVFLYQWSSTTPSSPSGSSTYDWITGTNSSYTGGGSWSVTVPSNPGTAGLNLWVAAKTITATAGTTSSSVSWTSGVGVYSISSNGANGANGTNGTNGANGLQTARPTVYQWAVTLPSSPTGTSTYTWSTSSFTPVPSGWSTSITSAPSAGYTLWAATVNISDTATATTTSINWGLSSILSAGYAGTNGATGATGATGPTGPQGNPGTNGTNGTNGLSSRICYAKSTSTSLNSTPATYQTTGSSSFPPYNTWGGAETWQATPPTISAGEALFQSDGIYDPTTNITTWNVPYLSNLKVGSLSAITTNTGNLTVSGTIQSNTAAISGTTMTGSGGVLYSSGNFAFGNSTTNISYNGTQMTLNGNVVATGNININAVTAISSATSSSGTVSLSASLNAGDSIIILTVADSVLTDKNSRFGNDSIKVGSTTIKSVTSYFGYYIDGSDNVFSVYPSTTIATNYTASSTGSFTFTGNTATYNSGYGYVGAITIILLVTKR